MSPERAHPYLPVGLPAPVPGQDGLDRPYWEGTRRHELLSQRCRACGRFQWGPERICHRCHSADLTWEQVPGPGVIYSWARIWHPAHPALEKACPYLAVVVELPEADGIRMLGNMLGDPGVDPVIGASVEPVFEDHDRPAEYTLVQWRTP